MPNSYPVYILDLSGTDRIVFPDDRLDVSHSDFWESIVAGIVAEHFRIPVKRLRNLPYCQRRARIVVQNDGESVVYFGERQTKKLLKAISRAVGLPDLEWRYDDHEQRLEYDVSVFNRLLDERRLPGGYGS